MSSAKFNPATVIVLIFIIATAALRLFFNFNPDISPLIYYSPIGAMAIFGGAYFDRNWKAFLLPLGVLFLSDVILHQTVFAKYSSGILYSGWWWVYGAFVLMVVSARWLMKNITIGTFLASALASVLIHWIVTDLGVWIGSKLYAQNLGGFIDCLTAAIPFERQFLGGTLGYGAVLFGGYALLKSRYPSLQKSSPEERSFNL